jgi:hypothetical protein
VVSKIYYILFAQSSRVLKDNGQISQSANLVDDKNDLTRVSLIWIYKDKKSYEACQKFHGQWAKIGGEYIGKVSGYRGEQIWGFN